MANFKATTFLIIIFLATLTTVSEGIICDMATYSVCKLSTFYNMCREKCNSILQPSPSTTDQPPTTTPGQQFFIFRW